MTDHISNPCIRGVSQDRTHAIRKRLLRPHQPIEAMAYPGDDLPDTLHLAAFDRADDIIGIASFYLEPHPLEPCAGDWRLRGMAVEPVAQGRGLGSGLVRAGIGHILEQCGKRLWCNARVGAQPFYERLGFVAQGERFEIDPIGPHWLMSIAVSPWPHETSPD